MNWRGVLLGCAAGLPLVPAWAAPPQVNLLVEMRAVSAAQEQLVESRGSVVVGTRQSAPAMAGDLRLSTRQQTADETQQVLVLNGGTAALRVGKLLPLKTGEWVLGTRDGADRSQGGGGQSGVGQTQQWVDVGSGFQVQPSWPGGTAPVTLELSAEAAARTTVQTRLLLQTATWTDFARNAQTVLQVRVSPQR